MAKIRQKVRTTEDNSEGLADPGRTRMILLAGLLLIVLLGLGLIIFIGRGGGRGSAESAVYQGVATDGRFLGDPNAPLLIRDFSDFTCPHCRDAAVELLPPIIEQYVQAGQVRIEFVPVAILNNDTSPLAAMASLCAEEQGAFWPYQAKLFDRQGLDRVESERLVSYASELGLEAQPFRDCLLSRQFAADIVANNEEFRRIGAEGTPTFVVGDTLVGGAVPFEKIQQVIEAELQ